MKRPITSSAADRPASSPAARPTAKIAAAAWLVQHVIFSYATRASLAAVRRGDRRRGLGIMGAATLGRLWLVTLAILLVGLLGEREDGLAAAVLTLVLVTVHLGCVALARLLYPPEAS